MARMQPPTLPFQASNPDSRAAGLDRARQSYQYDFSYGDMPFLASLPRSESFPLHYNARGLEVMLALAANRAASKVGGWTKEAAAAVAGDLKDRFARAAAGVNHLVQEAAAMVGGGGALELMESVEAWGMLYPTLEDPLSLAAWEPDWAFAWQRLAGPVPVLLAQVDAPPPWLPLTAAELGRSGRPLFVADYALFDGVPTGATDGLAKHLWAPVALFAGDATVPGGLVPLAIQVGGHSGRRDSLYLPNDADWLLARAAVQTADENLQGVLVHLGWCHLVIQRFIISGHRQLSTDHPLMRLLEPHFEFTLAVNEVARKSVINPGGVQDRLLAPTIDAQIALLNGSLAELDYDSLSPHVDFARRGVGDSATLPLYPFRDDSLPLWDATRRLVDGYVRLYYRSNADVAADNELAAWIREIGAPDGGRLPKLVAGVSLRTIDDVVELVTRVVFRATTYHAAINDSSYDFVSYAPNMPSSVFAPLPPRGTPAADALPAMLPPIGIAWEVLTSTYQVYALHVNRLGEYPPFADDRVAPLIARFQEDLRAIEAATGDRDAARPVPYRFLFPSRITASINA